MQAENRLEILILRIMVLPAPAALPIAMKCANQQLSQVTLHFQQQGEALAEEWRQLVQALAEEETRVNQYINQLQQFIVASIQADVKLDLGISQAQAVIQREFDQVRAGLRQNYDDSRAKLERKTLVGLVGMGVAIFTGGALAPLIASSLVGATSGALAITTAMVEGAITAGINGAIAGKNPLTAAIQGAAFAGLSCHLAEGPLSNLSALRQGAIISMTISGLSTLVNGGDPFKNMLAAGVASVLGEIAIPTKPGSSFTTREHAVRSAVTGITVAAMDGHGNLAEKVLGATVGACITTLGQNAGAQVSSVILNAHSESTASRVMMRDMNTSIGASEERKIVQEAGELSVAQNASAHETERPVKKSVNKTDDSVVYSQPELLEVATKEASRLLEKEGIHVSDANIKSIFEKRPALQGSPKDIESKLIKLGRAENGPKDASTAFDKGVEKVLALTVNTLMSLVGIGEAHAANRDLISERELQRFNVPNETLTQAELTPYTAPWFKRFAKALLRDNSPATQKWQASNQKLMAKEKVFIDGFTARQHERFSTPSLLPASHQNSRVEGTLRTCRAVGRAMDNISDGLLRLDRMAIDTGVLIWDASGAVAKVTFGTCTEGSQIRNEVRIKTVTNAFNSFMKADVAQKLDIITEVGATFALGGGFARLSGTLVRNASLPKSSPVRRIEFPLAQLETVPERFPEVTLVEQSLNASLPKPSPVRGIETTLRPSKEKSLSEGMFILYRPKSKQAFLDAAPETSSEVVLVKQSLSVSTNTQKLDQPSSLMAWDRFKTSEAEALLKGLAENFHKNAELVTRHKKSILGENAAAEIQKFIGKYNSTLDMVLAQEQCAAELYSNIRNITNDVAQISGNLKIPVFQVQRVKDHLFFNTHKLDHGMGIGRFDPDYKIATAWQRLEAGTHTEADLLLFRHEHFESRFEGIFRTDYRTAHKAAEDAGYPSGLDNESLLQEIIHGITNRH